MVRGLAIGAIAGTGFYLANVAIPSTKSVVIDAIVGLTVAAVFGAVALRYIGH